MPIDFTTLKTKLWQAADELRANSRLRSHEYSVPVLGLIFLKYADDKFRHVAAKLNPNPPSPNFGRGAGGEGRSRRRRAPGPEHYRAEGALYVPDEARFEHLLTLPEGENIGRAINEAMKTIETANPELAGVLPKTYNRLENPTLATLLRHFNQIEMTGASEVDKPRETQGESPSHPTPTSKTDSEMTIEGDLFGKIYEYFLGQFAKAEGQRGGEFFTPTSVVKLIVEIIEPYQGRIYDPACGSGGMFVQSANFVARHRTNGDATSHLSIYGQEKTAGTVNLAKMNLAVNGLEGDIRQGNTYYEDLHRSPGKFDFVMANPPFNVDNVDKERLKNDARFPFGLPSTNNANYLWVQLFYSALNESGRAGFVMANSASDARHSEQTIRRQLIEAKAVDVMVAVGSNFFLTVTLPCTLWFLDRGKIGTERENTVLFIDARPIYRQVERALRDFTASQIAFIANIVRLYRGETPEWLAEALPLTPSQKEGEQTSPPLGGIEGGLPVWADLFPNNQYQDVPGLCKVATLTEIEQQGWSLNPGRYVGVADRPTADYDFAERLQELHEELELLNVEAHDLEERISENVVVLLEGER